MKRSKLTLLAIAVVSPLIAYGAIILTVPNPVQPASAANGDGCPTGSYNIGITKDGSPLCKLEPTGCPFGDSIPLDSPKCAPPADIICNADWTDCKPKTESEPTNATPSDDSSTRSTSGKEEQPASCSSSK